jgi:hypothetical protein
MQATFEIYALSSPPLIFERYFCGSDEQFVGVSVIAHISRIDGKGIGLAGL